MAILPKEIYIFIAMPFEIPMSFFSKIEKSPLKIHMEAQKTSSSKSNLE
jgi:hypothetical protein